MLMQTYIMPEMSFRGAETDTLEMILGTLAHHIKARTEIYRDSKSPTGIRVGRGSGKESLD